MFYDHENTVERPADGIAVIHCPEIFDVYTAPRVRETHADLIRQLVYSHVFDLSHTRRIDSTGLGVLVGALKRARAHSGIVILDSPTPNVRNTLFVTGLEKVFHVVEAAGIDITTS